MCDTVAIPGNLMIIEPSSGERNVCDKLRGIGGKKSAILRGFSSVNVETRSDRRVEYGR